jgi:hypothetical protein
MRRKSNAFELHKYFFINNVYILKVYVKKKVFFYICFASKYILLYTLLRFYLIYEMYASSDRSKRRRRQLEKLRTQASNLIITDSSEDLINNIDAILNNNPNDGEKEITSTDQNDAIQMVEIKHLR